MAAGTLAGFGIALGVGQVVAGFKSMISAASDLDENINKVKAIFGEGSASVIADSNAMAKAFGTSKNEYLDAAGKFGGLFKGAGFASKETAALSQSFVRLAGDAASFYNTDFETAFNKLRSGLSGEAEPLRDFGVFLDEDKTKAYAYSHGIATLGQELTNQQKIQSRLQQITESLSDANGDLARTSGGVANLTRNAWGQLENLGATVGAAFLPVVQKALTATAGFLGAIGDWAASSGVLTTIGSLIDSFVVAPIEFVAGLIKGVNDLLLAFGVDLVGMFTGALKVISEVARVIAGVIKSLTYGRKETEATVAAASGVPKFKQVVQQSRLPKAADLKHATEPTTYAGADVFGSKEAFSAILRSKAELSAGLARQKGAVAAPTQFAGAAVLGSKDAYSATQGAKEAAAIADPQRQLVAHAKVTADAMLKQLELLKQLRDIAYKQLTSNPGGAILASI